MKLFGKPINLRKEGCMINGIKTGSIGPYVNLYIRITDGCNALCQFCCNGGPKPHRSFDTGKLAGILSEIGRSGIRLNRIILTGGEISTRPDLVREVVGLIEETASCRFTRLLLQTNGISSEARSLMALRRVDAVSLSFHHYDFKRLAELYRCPVPDSLLDLRPDIMARTNLSCNLIRGYIDSPAEIHRLLSFVSAKGFHKIGFVGLMKLNEYCHANYIDPWQMDFESVPGLYRVEEKSNGAVCRCRNYIYMSQDRPVEVYVRETIDPSCVASSLLFDGKYLRHGFNNDNIVSI